MRNKIKILLIIGFGFFIFNPQEIFAKNTDTIIDQEHFRFYDDDGTTVNNATGYGAGNAAIDTNITSVPLGTQFHIRLGALQTANKPDLTLSRTVKLQYSTDASGTCSSGSWTDVPTQSGYTSQAFAQFTTGNFADGDATTRLLDTTHTHIGGDGVETDGSPNTASFTNGGLANTEHAEWEWAIEEKAGSASTQYWFRFVNSDGSTTNVTWATCPSLTTAAGTSFTQNSYRWYTDDDTLALTSNDPWGTPDIAQNTAITITPVSNDPPSSAQELRLRMNITVNNSNLSASSQQFKLQFRTGTDTDCSTGSWTDVGAVAATAWQFATSSVTDGTTLTTNKLTSDVLEVYAKANPTATNPNGANTGQTMEYDFHIVGSGTNFAGATQYLFRAVESDDTVFDAYTNCAVLQSEPGTGDLLRHGGVFSGGSDQGFFWAD